MTRAATVVASGQDMPTTIQQAPGHKLDPVATLLLLASAANFIRVCVTAYEDLKKAKGRAPTLEEYLKEVLKQGASLGESALKLAAAVYKISIPRSDGTAGGSTASSPFDRRVYRGG